MASADLPHSGGKVGSCHRFKVTKAGGTPFHLKGAKSREPVKSERTDELAVSVSTDAGRVRLPQPRLNDFLHLFSFQRLMSEQMIRQGGQDRPQVVFLQSVVKLDGDIFQVLQALPLISMQ